jgi:hypothetical protein
MTQTMKMYAKNADRYAIHDTPAIGLGKSFLAQPQHNQWKYCQWTMNNSQLYRSRPQSCTVKLQARTNFSHTKHETRPS